MMCLIVHSWIVVTYSTVRFAGIGGGGFKIRADRTYKLGLSFDGSDGMQRFGR